MKRQIRSPALGGLALMLLSVVLQGCGLYRLGSTLPPNLKTIYIPTFRNNTYEPGIEVDVTNEVIDRFRIDGNLRPVDRAEADTVLLGEIVGWQRQVLDYTGIKDDVVDEYRLYVVARITFKNLRSSEIILPTQTVKGKVDFYVEGTLAESEELARPDAYEDLARQIVDAVVAFW